MLVEGLREVVVGELEVVDGALGEAAVETHGLTEVGVEHRLVVGAGTQDGHQIVGGGVGGVDGGESRLGLAVIFGKNLCQGGVVALAVAEGAQRRRRRPA